ncbi:DUF5931 domain-containing protein [Solwaraspora sp. WMMD1047]|uniref:MacS family sensor histidine kinase n=1 Tax=Solwaraspora sp. WMMD1047 TaxID=3016102 RepID=UPI002415E2DF|nr:DUF5931 domain-containing protein [Solwaraspora sp. WMMD1047]MDG4833169.1 DUF5931 domain-containing protein [Solwaraspora sp. WMMD1047]
MRLRTTAVVPAGGVGATGPVWQGRRVPPSSSGPGRTGDPPGSFQLPLWRAIAVFRFAALGYVVVLAVRNLSQFARPGAAAVVLVAMAGWTVLTAYAYARPDRRRWPLLSADLAVALAALLVSPWVIGRSALAAGVPTLGVAWLAAPVLTWAVSGGRRRGLAAALVLAAADLAVRVRITGSSFTGGILMVLAGFTVGHVTRLAASAEERLQRAVELEAATRERERLARGIHDSVLQVLAMVQRRGAQLGGEAGELARLAGEQEAALRSLIATGPAQPAERTTGGPAGAGRTGGPAGGDELDLRVLLGGYSSPTVSMAMPATPIRLPAPVARELAAAVKAALDNAAQHGGGRAWVLVEEEDEAVTVSIRDDGPGIPPGRLEAAAGQGRLGVAQSIQGRITDLGGSAKISSAPGEGTEVELRLPRR